MRRSFWAFAGRSIVVHTLTYTLAAVAIALLMRGGLDEGVAAENLFRSVESPWSFAGPFLQPVRGLVFALAVWPVWDMFVSRRFGWIRLWILLLGVGVVASPVAGVGSLEGFLRTSIDTDVHTAVLPELILQTVAFSLVLVLWDRWALRRELKAPGSGASRNSSGLTRCGLVAAMGYVGVAAGGLVVIAGSPALSFEDLRADSAVQLFNVVLIVVNFIVARILAARLFVQGVRRTGFLSFASLLALVLFFGLNAGGAAVFDNYVGGPMPTALILAVYAVSSLILWVSAVTLLPGVPAGGSANAGTDGAGAPEAEPENLDAVDDEGNPKQ